MYASAKPTMEILGLFQQVEKLDVDGLARAEVYERAERYFVNNKEKIKFKTLPRKSIKYDGDLPSSFKVRINDEELDLRVNEIIRDKYNIKRVMTPFKFKIVLSAYLEHLVGVEDNFSEEVNGNINYSNSLRIKAISLILKIKDEKLASLLELLEEKYI